MKHGLISIQLVVRNEAHRIRKCLDAVRAQSYTSIETFVLDNASDDGTADLVVKEFPWVHVIRSEMNYGFGGGHNRLLSRTNGEFVIALSADVIMDKDFCTHAVACMHRDPSIGALQGKTYRGKDLHHAGSKHLDTTGFQIFRSRRLINRGHGELDTGQYEQSEEIFSFEGAAGFFRRAALEDAKIYGELYDEDLFWYATDIDIGWRLRMLGWKSWYYPKAVMYHDRPTTERLSKDWWDFVKIRRNIPLCKRQLEFRNLRLVWLKYDFVSNFLRDFPFILKRELLFFLYILVFEPGTLLVIPSMVARIPRMLKKRRNIIRRRKTTAGEIRKWFRS